MAEVKSDRRQALELALLPSSASSARAPSCAWAQGGALDEIAVDPDRRAHARPGARHRRHPARPRHRDLRAGVLRQDHAGAPRHRRGPARGRHRRLHRRRARARPDLRQEARRQHRRAADLAARHRRAGAGDRRDAGALQRGRRHRDRLGGGPGAEGRARGRHGRLAAGPAGAAHVPGPAQAHRRHRALRRRRDLHQPDPREDRRHVRQPGDDHGRPRAQVLRLGPPRHPAAWTPSSTARRRSASARRSRW